jgi:hypothetical protein
LPGAAAYFLPLTVHVSSVPDLDDRYRTPLVVHIMEYPVFTGPDTPPSFSLELAAALRTRTFKIVYGSPEAFNVFGWYAPPQQFFG